MSSLNQEARIYLTYIDEQLCNLKEFFAGVDFDIYRSDVKLQKASQMSLQYIGRACASIVANDPACAEKFPRFPWVELIDLEEMLRTRYYAIDLESLWDTIDSRIPAIREVFYPDFEDDLRLNSNLQTGIEPELRDLP